MKRRLLACSLALCVATVAMLTGAAEASACGALAPPINELESVEVSMKAQKALVHVRADTVDVHLQVTASTQADAFAWFFPVAAGAQLAEGHPKLFKKLERYTKPSVQLTYPAPQRDGAVGCGGASTGGATGPTLRAGGVDVVEAGRIGDYSFQIVEASDSSDLVGWLDENGYHTPDGSAVLLDRYVEQGMNFAAVQLAADVEQLDREPDTLVVSSPRNGDAFVYPLLLSKLSAPSTSELLIYTLATRRYTADTPFTNADLQGLADRMAAMHQATGDADYTQALDEMTEENDGRLAVTEFAADLEEAYRCDIGRPYPDSLESLLAAGEASFLTRMHLRVPRTRLTDLELYPAADSERVDPNASVSLGGTTAASFLFLLAVLPLARFVRRRAGKL